MIRGLTAFGAAIAVAASAAPAAQALAPLEPDAGAWVPGSGTTEVIHAGSRTVVGGYFNYWGPFTGAAMRLSPSAASPGLTRGQVTVGGGSVTASVADGSGGAYLTGDFRRVNGQPRGGLAHVTSTGSLDPTFAPTVNGVPWAITLSGNTVYVGGQGVSAVRGTGDSQDSVRKNLVAFNATSGALSTWAPCPFSPNTGDAEDGAVRALAASGSAIFIGGRFTQMGALDSGGACQNQTPVSHLASVSATTGAANAFASAVNDTVRTLLVVGSTLYVGGDFDGVSVNGGGAIARGRGLAVATSTGQPTAWDPKADQDVRALAAGPSGDVFIGGTFTHVGSPAIARSALARVSGSSGAPVVGFDAGLQATSGGLVTYGLAVSGTHVLIGGTFTLAGKESLAMVDVSTGAAQTLDVQPSGVVVALSTLTGGGVMASGGFSSSDAVRRDGLVVLDERGIPTSVTLPVGTYVTALGVSPDGRTVYYQAGKFGSPKYLGSIDVETGAAGPWAPANPPGFNDLVHVIWPSADGQTVYVGGQFSAIGGAPRANLAATSAATGAVTGWRPDPDGPVYALEETGGLVYAGGAFQHIGTGAEARSSLARVSSVTAVTDPSWAPVVDNNVRSMARSSDASRIYVVGAFTHAGSPLVTRDGSAAFATSTGNLTPFNPAIGPIGVDVAATNDDAEIYIVGSFQTPVGPPGSGVFGGASGAYTAWNPFITPYSGIERIDALDDTVWLGSDSRSIGAEGRPYYAQFTTKPAVKTAPQISGSAVAGRALTCVAAAWRNSVRSTTVAWLRDGTAIAGAAGRTYVLGADDVGHKLSCEETAVNSGGNASAASVAVSVAAAPVEGGANGGGNGGGGPQLTPPPAALTLSAKAKSKKFARAKGSSISVSLSAPATVTVTIALCPAKGKCKKPKLARTINAKLVAGASKLAIGEKKHRLRAGKYVITVVAHPASGADAAPVSFGVTVTK